MSAKMIVVDISAFKVKVYFRDKLVHPFLNQAEVCDFQTLPKGKECICLNSFSVIDKLYLY